MNNAIKEFLPLGIIAMLGLVIAGIIAGDLTLTLLFILSFEGLLLLYFMDSLNVGSTIKIALKMMLLAALVMATITAVIIAITLLQEIWANILLIIAIVLVAAQIIIVYRNR